MPRTQELSKPLLAVAGVGDVAVAKLRELPAEARRLQQRARSLDRNALRVAVEDYTARVAGTAVTTYGDLVMRGEKLVTNIRRQPASQDQTASRAVATTTAARKTAKAAGKTAGTDADRIG
jgi:hypothetical protein